MNLPIVYYIQELLSERATSEQTDLYGYTNMSNFTCKTYNMMIEVNEDQKKCQSFILLASIASYRFTQSLPASSRSTTQIWRFEALQHWVP